MVTWAFISLHLTRTPYCLRKEACHCLFNRRWPIMSLFYIQSIVMNLVPTHSNCTSPMDYISHHALHSHIPVHHYTNHTAVTIHSSLWLPHHTCTSFSHSHKSSTLTLTQCEVLFSPGYISERSPIHPAISVWPRTARPWNSEPVPVTSTSAWYCLRLCFASDIPVMPADHCLCDSAAV